MPKAFAMSEDFAGRVVEVVERVEDMPRDPSARRRGRPGARQNIQELRVTGSPTAGAGGVNYYPAVVQYFDPEDGTWSDADDTVWLIQRVGAALTTAGTGKYLARQLGNAVEVDDVSRPLFVTDQRPYVVDVQCDDGEIVVSYSV